MKQGFKERAEPIGKTISPKDSQDPLVPYTREGSKKVPHSQYGFMGEIVKVGLGSTV